MKYHWYKSSFNQLSLHHKMLLITLLTTLTALIITFIIFIGLELVNQYEDAKQQLTVSGQTISTNIHSALVFNDSEFAHQILQSLKIQEKIQAAALYRADGSLVAKYQLKTSLNVRLPQTQNGEGISRQGAYLTYHEKLYQDKELLGSLYIRFELITNLKQILWKALILLIIFAFSSIIAYLVWSKLQPSVTLPINLLLDSIKQVTRLHDYSITVPKHSEDELGQLIDGFNEMLSQVQNRDKLLEEHSKHLESNVIKRTHDLMQEKMNAEAANRSKSEFLATMSHEIRTPMNAILGFSYLTLQTSLNSQQQENIQNINHSAQSLLNIINDILDFSKMDVGKMEIDNITFDINKLISQISNTMKITAEQKGLKFTIDLAHQEPQYLIGDPNRLRQVLINLIGNSIKFTRIGEVKLAVECSEINTQQIRLTFKVSDTGIGISSKQQKSLFKLFSQVDSSITQKFGGTGLGLAISQRLINLMGGEIAVHSIKNQGSTFFFSLTFDQADMLQLTTENQFDKADIPTDLKGCCVLVVEDQYINQQVAKSILEQAGIIVYIANNGLEAVNLIKDKKQTYHAILMDLQMPEMSGFEATNYIRENLNETEIPIIAMTANVLFKDQKQFNSAGMNDYIPKPINPNHLFKVLHKWIKSSAKSDKQLSDVVIMENPLIKQSNNTTNLPFTLPGINIKNGLERINGDQKLYKSILLSFLNDKKNIIRDLNQAFDNRQMDECKKISHSIKGLAGNLSAESLFQQASQLDQEFSKSHYNTQALANFEQAFNELINGLKEMKNDSLLQQQISSSTKNNPELNSHLEEIKLLLKEGNFKAVNSLHNIENLFDKTHISLYRQLEEETMSFNFNSALETLETIQTTIQG